VLATSEASNLTRAYLFACSECRRFQFSCVW